MLQISEAVRSIVYENDEVLGAMSRKYLNFTAYAKSIKKRVEERTKKSVKIGSIVVALTRLAEEFKFRPIEQPVEIENLTIKSPLSEISFDKTPAVVQAVKKFNFDNKIDGAEFLTVTQGTDEITIICSQKTKSKIKSEIKVKAKFEIEGLVAISVRFTEKYINQPNVIYSLLRRLAVKRINIVEVVSTYTELTFLIEQKDLEKVMGEFKS